MKCEYCGHKGDVCEYRNWIGGHYVTRSECVSKYGCWTRLGWTAHLSYEQPEMSPAGQKRLLDEVKRGS